MITTLSQLFCFHHKPSFRLFSHFLLLLLVNISFVSATNPEWHGWPPHDKTSPFAKKIIMRDGVPLQVMGIQKESFQANQKRATLLVRSPYNIGSFLAKWISQQIAHDNNLFVLLQDMRGRFHSGGQDTIFEDDWRDGIDTIKWLRNSPEAWWWNSKLGSYGASALGITQFCYAGEGIPELKAQVIQIATPEQFDHIFFQGGQLRYNLTMSWSKKQSDQAHQYFLKNLAHRNKKDNFWHKRSMELNNRYSKVNAAAIHWGGWDDTFSQGTIDGFVGYRNKANPEVRSRQFLVMGGIGHAKMVGEIHWPNADYKAKDLEAFLFDAELNEKFGPRGSKTYEAEWEKYPRVHYYIYSDPKFVKTDSRACAWQKTNTWPIPHTKENWYFHAGTNQWQGVLKQSIPQQNAQLSYIYDPNNPCPTNGGNNLFSRSFDTRESIGIGSTDQRGSKKTKNITRRSDVLSFTSPPFSKPYEFVGRIYANLYIQSNAPDTDFVVKLADVFPDGREMLITDGILRAVRRNGSNKTDWLKINQTYLLKVDLWSKAWRFQPGHRLKVFVTSSNYPRFQRNPNLKHDIIPVKIQ